MASLSKIKDLAGYVWNLNGAIAATADSAQRSGLGNQAFQGLQLAAGRKGISNEDFNGAMIGFNQQIGLAKNGLGDLKTLLSSNGQTVSDTATTFGVVADLVKRAAGDTRLQFSILQQTGLPASVAFVKYMEQGAASIQKQSDAAGKLTDQELIDAKRIDDAWNSGWVKFENWGKRAVVNVGGAISAMASHFSRSLNASEGGGLQESPMEIARRKLGAGQGNRLDSSSSITDFYRGVGPTGATGQPKPPPDPNITKQLIGLELQRLSLLSPLAQAEDVVKQKQLEINLAALANVHISRDQAEALKIVTLAQYEMTRVQTQATLGVFDLTKANKAAADQLQSWIAQKLLDPTNVTQMAAAQTVAAKATEKLGDAAAVAGSKFEQLKQYQIDASNGRTTFDKFATSSLDTVSNGFADAIMKVKTFQDTVKSMSLSVLSDLIKISLKSAIFGPAAGLLGNFAGSFGGGSTLNATPWAFPKFAGGTNNAPGGLAIVNEGGRGEIIDLPSGSRVIPHDVSMRMASSGGGVTISGDTNLVIQGNADDKTLQAMQRELISHRQQLAAQLKQVQSQNRYASTGVR